MVQFRALVTPCLPTCEPVVCDVRDFGGQMKQAESYGRKKRDLTFLDFGVEPIVDSAFENQESSVMVSMVSVLIVVSTH